MWVALPACNISEKELPRLLAALPACPDVTFLDLSTNMLTDAAARQLADSLADTATLPNLISIDLRNNLLGEEGRKCLADFQVKRKMCKVGERGSAW